jgi:hypothetical protein
MPSTQSTLSGWLATLDADALIEVLRLRPDAASPPPKSLVTLADRLSVPNSVHRALDALDLATLDVVEAVQTLGDGALTSDLGRLIRAGTRTKHAEIDRCLTELRRYALVWPGPNGSLRLAGPLRAGHAAGLGLGATLRDLLLPMVNPALHRIAAAYGLKARKSKTDAVNDLVVVLAAPDRVRQIVAEAPEHVRPMLDTLVWQDPVVRSPVIAAGAERDLWGPPEQQWLMHRGLLLPVGQHTAVMPQEVVLALRGPDHAAPIRTAPPAPRLRPGVQSDVDAAASAAAGSTVDGVARLLELCDDTPLALLQNGPGGVGTRELRRAARALSTSEALVRLWLTIAYQAGLVGKAPEGVRQTEPAWLAPTPNEQVLPTEYADGWLASTPAERLPTLLSAWWGLAVSPTLAPVNEKQPPALAPGYQTRDRPVRHELLGWLAGQPVGSALVDRAELVARLCWQRPRIHRDRDILAAHADPIFAEAEWLGITSNGALSSWGRALVAAGPDTAGTGAAEASLVEALREVLPAATTTARFQVDLTAVVAGSPAAPLVALLNRTADAEDRDTASVWRFNPSSVRRALDIGYSVDRLITELAGVSANGELPQPLVYLIKDVGRRHGELAVRSVGCCVIASDESLLMEIAAHSGLAALRPQLLAPTVLASAKSATDTMALLRQRGYAPVLTKNGQAVVERREVRRAPAHQPAPNFGHPAGRPAASSSVAASASAASASAEQLAELVERLLSGDEPPPPDERPGAYGSRTTAQMVRERAERLSDAEIDLLADAIDRGTPVEIDYVEQGVGHSRRVITPKYHYGNRIKAWCHLRKEDRAFRVSRIQSVCAV